MLMDIGKIIRAARKDAGLTQMQLAEACKWESQSRISGYERGEREPSMEDISVMAKALGFRDGLALMSASIKGELQPQVKEDHPDYVAVPFKSVTLRASNDGATGYEIHFEDEQDRPPLYYRKDWLKRHRYRVEALSIRQVTGSSMEPALFDGDTVLTNKDSKLPKNGVVFEVVIDGSPCIKRLRKRGSEWWITSDNPAHSVTDLPLENEQQIIGEIVERRSSHI